MSGALEEKNNSQKENKCNDQDSDLSNLALKKQVIYPVISIKINRYEKSNLIIKMRKRS